MIQISTIGSSKSLLRPVSLYVWTSKEFVIELLLATTFWAACAMTLIVCWAGLRGANSRQLVWQTLNNRVVLVALICGSAATATLAIDMSYAAPRDIMQDIVSADQWWKGSSLYPFPMTEQIHQMLEAQPVRWSLGNLAPALRAREVTAYEITIASHWVQAHPPLMTFAVALPMRLMGARPTILLVNFVSLLALAASVLLLLRGFGVSVSRTRCAAIIALLLGWYPVIYLLRVGQSGLLLLLLMIAGWQFLRKGQPVAAGVAIGLATALKLYPGLLLVYLLLRNRKAFASALGTVAAAFLSVGLLAGWDVFRQYSVTVNFVTETYRNYPSNFSLTGWLTYLSRPTHVSELWTGAIFLVLAAGMMAVPCLLCAAGPGWSEGLRPTPDDALYGTLIALMPLLSPIAWQHYWVVLVFPLFIIALRVAEGGDWKMLAAFCCLVALLSIPEPTFNAWTEPAGARYFLSGAIAKTVPTLCLIGTYLWTAGIAISRRRQSRPEVSPKVYSTV